MPNDTNPDARAPSAPSHSRTRPVDAVFSRPQLHWVGDGFRVAGYMNVVPNAARRLSPFLLLDYHPPYFYEAITRARGVGVHPHRGFETVTIAWEGRVAHHDSTGAGGIIGPGDVQWMRAASGILHKEFHEAAWAKEGGTMHMAQLWVNLPRSEKMGPPSYQPLSAGDMGLVTLADDAGVVRIIAGEFAGVRGPARTATRVNLFDAQLRAGGRVTFTIPPKDNIAALVMRGAVLVNGVARAGLDTLVLFENAGDTIVIEAAEDSHVLLMGGEPIDEPIFQHGPFVMTTREEIVQAYEDFHSGKFGFLAN